MRVRKQPLQLCTAPLPGVLYRTQSELVSSAAVFTFAMRSFAVLTMYALFRVVHWSS